MKPRISMSSLGVIAFVLFFSASCIPEFKNPLPVPKGVKPDQKILGTWETEGIGEKFQVSFFPPAKSGHMYIVWINIEGPEYEPDISIWRGYTTIIGMVQSRRLKGNTFQGSSMTRNTHNNLLEQELRRIRQFAGFREVLPCSEP